MSLPQPIAPSSSAIIKFPRKRERMTPKPSPAIQSVIDEWKAQATFAELCKKHGVNIHRAQRYLYGKVKL